MLTVNKAKYGDVVDLEQYFPEGRLTEPTDGKRYEWRKMIELVKEFGRPLTESESERFRIR